MMMTRRRHLRCERDHQTSANAEPATGSTRDRRTRRNTRTRLTDPGTSDLLPLFTAAAAFALACTGTEPPEPAADAGADVVDVDADADAGAGCDDGLTSCDDSCVDLATSDEHCGACGSACGVGGVCSDGECGCADGLERCGPDCADLGSDPANCGTCGVACGAEEVCNAGECALECADDLIECAGGCVDPATDLLHCGGCERPCAGDDNEDAVCDDGTCVVTCATGFHDLDGGGGCEYPCAPDDPRDDDPCDGEDNDCDGFADAEDPDFVAVACPLQVGVCAGAAEVCIEGAPTGCDAIGYADHAGVQPYDPDFETWCDGLDNNCTGLADEDCCDVVDFPLAVPPPDIPLGLTNFFEMTSVPLVGPDGPIALATAAAAFIGDDGMELRQIVGLAAFPAEGGFGTFERYPELDSLDVYDALAREDHIEAWVESEAGVAVARLGYDGVLIDGPTDVGEVNAELVGDVVAAAVAPAADGQTHVVVQTRTPSGRAFFRIARVNGGALDATSSWEESSARLRAVTLGGLSIVVCYSLTGDAEELLTCRSYRHALDTHRIATLFEASFADLTASQRFVSDGAGNHVLYVAEADGARIREVVIDPDGDVTATPTSIGTEGGIAVTGLTPTGEIALLIGAAGDGPGDGDLASVRTELVLPRSDGRVVASWEGPLAFPVGILTASDRSFVLVRANTYEPTVSRTHAFRLSQDGRALCLE